MLDNPLITLLIATIIAGEAVAGIPNTPVQQAFQPTQQGVPSAASIFTYKIGDHPLGTAKRSDCYDKTSGTIIHTEEQDYETTFQFSALSIQDPDNQSQYTASDILNLVRSILQSTTSIESLADQGIGILKIDQVRDANFVDDYGRNEYGPSLDFTVQHKQVIISTSPIVSSVEIIVDRV